MSKRFVVTIISICVLCAVFYFLGVMAGKQPLVNYGIVDNNGKTVVPIKYGATGFVEHNKFFVKKDIKNYIYDKETKTLTPIEYDGITKVNDNLYFVIKGGKIGFVDKNYKILVPIQFLNMNVYKNLIQVSKKDKDSHIFDLNGKELFKTNDYYIYFYNNNLTLAKPANNEDKYIVLDTKGKKVATLDYEDVRNFSEGLATFKQNGKWGVMDMNFKEVLPPIYKSIGSFEHGYAIISNDAKPFTKERKTGVIDKTGKIIIPMEYMSIRHFSDGFFVVNNGRTNQYFDVNGKKAISKSYLNATPFSEGLAAVGDISKRGFIDKTGKEVIPFIYKDTRDFHNGYAVVAKEDNSFMGKKVDNFMNDNASEEFNNINSLAKYGVIDKTGKEVIPLKYDFVIDENLEHAAYFPFDNSPKEKNNYFVVGKINKFAIFGRLMGFKNYADRDPLYYL